MINKFVYSQIKLLKEKYKARNLKMEKRELIGANNFTKLMYDLPDNKLKVSRKYIEYYTTCDKNTLRIIFWTMEASRGNWLRDETVEIIKTIKSGVQ